MVVIPALQSEKKKIVVEELKADDPLALLNDLDN
jgi:hypothetical protein